MLNSLAMRTGIGTHPAATTKNVTLGRKMRYSNAYWRLWCRQDRIGGAIYAEA